MHMCASWLFSTDELHSFIASNAWKQEIMNWFAELTGFTEDNPDQVRSQLRLDGQFITSKITKRRMRHGTLTIPTLSELRNECCAALSKTASTLRKVQLRDIVADVRMLHLDPKNAGAVFQVASQFNLLEMLGPNVSPAAGISGYDRDRTQGPVCAMACGGATLYRHYFVPVNGKVGQTPEAQVDCLRDLGAALGNGNGDLWEMRNGYALPLEGGLQTVARRLAAADAEQVDKMRGLMRIGVHADAEVTIARSGYTVSQALCAALPVAYCAYEKREWEPFARLVLEASYEAVLCAAVVQMARTGCSKVFLTLLGGGAFGNPEPWIIAAMRRALLLFEWSGLDVFVVSHGQSNKAVRKLVEEF